MTRPSAKRFYTDWSARRRQTRFRHLLTGLLAGASGLNAVAGPHGMHVQRGNVNAVQNGQQLNINASHNAVINWQSFNINAGETVNFIQPNSVSVVWNRILDTNPSQIWGSLNANGIVILMNQNGFYFGPNSSINVGGLVVTTSPISPTSPIGGGLWQYTGAPPLASIINYGEVKAHSGGSLFLISEKIENHGVLSAPGGSLNLYAGKEVLINERPDGRGISAKVRLPQGSIDNSGKLIADAGSIALHAEVVNNGGLIQANSVRQHNGVIELVASEKIELGADSHIQANGDVAGVSSGGKVTVQAGHTFLDHAGSTIEVTGGLRGGRGGSLELSAPHMASLHSQLDGRATKGWKGGYLFFDPTDIILTSDGGASGDPAGTVLADDSPGATLRLNVNSAFANFSTIHLQATHDISLEAGTVWNLNDSTGVSTPGSMLTLEAGNNIYFGDNARIIAGTGWSVKLAAGVNFSLPSLDVTRGVGSIYLNGGPADINGAKPNGSGSIESYDGDVTLAAGHEILVGGGYIRTAGGGNIHVTTGDGDVDAGTKNDGYEFSRVGYTVSNRGLGGIGTVMGGTADDQSVHGGVTIDSGRDILAFNAPIGAFGGGNVDLIAARDIKGQFMLRDGTGNLTAHNDVGSSSSPISLGLVKGGWNVSAGNNLYLNEVYNPNGSLNGNRVVFGARIPYYFDYALDAFANLSAGGSVELLGNDPVHSAGNINRPIILPPKLTINAGADVVLGNDMILAPSPLGSLDITTTGHGSLRSLDGGFYQLVVSDSGSADYQTFASGHKSGSPLHLNSSDAGVHLDIAGDVRNVFLRVPRQASLRVGGDAVNFSFEGQNLAASDVTTLQIGGNFLSRSDRTSVTLSGAPNLTVFDPLLTLSPDLAGRVVYDPITKKLTFQGIMTAAERDFLLHPMVYVFDKATNDILRDSRGNPVIVPAQFVSDPTVINDLYARSQDIPTSPLARNGLQIGGPGGFNIAAHNLDLGISSGIRSVGLLLNPALAAVSAFGANLKVTLGGDLDITSSQIASFNGGNIEVTSLGKMNIGSSDKFSSDDTPKGIYTGHGGNLTIRADSDIDINGSRIATYDGGDISVISDRGSIDAGSGGKGFFNVTTSVVDPKTGQVVIRNDKYFGSGIVALTRPDSRVKVGNITVSAGMMNPPENPDPDHIKKGIGDIIANAGGILQLAFNHVDQSGATVSLIAKGDIEANQSGILGGNVDLKAGGDIKGLVVARGNLGIVAQQNVSVTALAGGTANVSSGGTVSGSIVGGVAANVTGSEVSANVISTGSGASSSSAFKDVAAPVAQQTTTDDKKVITAKTDKDDEDEKKRRAAPVLAKTSGRVTVILPKYN